MNHFVGQISCVCEWAVAVCHLRYAWRASDANDSDISQRVASTRSPAEARSQDSFSLFVFFSNGISSPFAIFAYKCSLVAWYGQGFMSGECIATTQYPVTHMAYAWAHTHSPAIKQSYIFALHGKWQRPPRVSMCSVCRPASVHMNYDSHTRARPRHNESFVCFRSTFR